MKQTQKNIKKLVDIEIEIDSFKKNKFAKKYKRELCDTVDLDEVKNIKKYSSVDLRDDEMTMCNKVTLILTIINVIIIAVLVSVNI